MKQGIKIKQIGFLLLGAVLTTCSPTDSLDERRLGHEFFPLAVGNYYTYQVDETHYNFEGTVDITSYQLVDSIVSTFVNQAGNLTYVIHQYKKGVDQIWRPHATLSARDLGTGIVVTEGNIPYLKLSFPVKAGKMWDGNAYNNLAEDIYTLDSLNLPFNTVGGNFPQTLTVIIENNEDFFINLQQEFEVYALGVGLVYYERKNLVYCTENECFGEQQIEEGEFIQQQLTDYGKI